MKLKRKTYTVVLLKAGIQSKQNLKHLISSNWSVPIIHYVIFCEIGQSADWKSTSTGNQCKYLKNKMSWSVFQHYMNYNYIRDWHGFNNPSWESSTFYIYIYAFSRHFYPKRLTVHSGYNLFCPYMCSLGIEPTTFALLTQCSNHWATGTRTNELLQNNIWAGDLSITLVSFTRYRSPLVTKITSNHGVQHQVIGCSKSSWY